MILYNYMIPNLIKINKQILGSSLSLLAYGRAGQGQHLLAAHFAKRNTKNCDSEKRSGESEDGQKFLPPPTPFLFALSREVRQSKFAVRIFVKKVRIFSNTHRLAEGEGFEPPVSFPTVVFKTTPFGRSGIPPYGGMV